MMYETNKYEEALRLYNTKLNKCMTILIVFIQKVRKLQLTKVKRSEHNISDLF